MRQSQKTEQADHQSRIGLEDSRYTGARSTFSGEGTMISGMDFVKRVLTRSNLNQAYLRVKKNKGAAGLDGMTIEDLLPYLKDHKEKLVEQLAKGTYRPQPVKRVEIPKPNGGKRKLEIGRAHD